MLSLHELHRVVYRHAWGSLSEWVNGIDRLADLSDAEVEDLVRAGPVKEEASASR